jgi:hypothetical protein
VISESTAQTSVGRPAVAAALVCAVLLSGGCQHRELVARGILVRERSLEHVRQSVVESEAIRPSRLRQARTYVAAELRKDADDLTNALLEAENLLNADVRRFEERQPTYQAECRRLFAGKPERIEPTAILLFW